MISVNLAGSPEVVGEAFCSICIFHIVNNFDVAPWKHYGRQRKSKINVDRPILDKH